MEAGVRPRVSVKVNARVAVKVGTARVAER